MTRIPAAILVASLLLAAWSWHPREDVPGWFVELCAEVATC